MLLDFKKMNPENQNQQNTNPDLDFIRNTTDPLETPVKKGLDKKIIVIIVLVVITLGVLVFGMVTGANKKVQKSSDTNESSKTVAKAKDTINSLFEYADSNDTESAYSLFSSNSAITKDDFNNESMLLFNKLDLTSCRPVSSDKGLIDKNNRVIQTYDCRSKDNQYSVTVEFSLDSSNSGQLTIYYLNMVKIV